MFFIAYTFKRQVHVFAGGVKIVSHLSCRTSAILKYFCSLAAYIQVHFRLEFFMEANNMNPDQTAPKGSV